MRKKEKTKRMMISVKDVHKSFKIPHEKSRSLKSVFVNLFKKKTYTEYSAAKGISFNVEEGEFLGIIGRNGSGKSTMLKMIAGIYQPDSGEIQVNGKLSPFIELGVGFNPELSARDNVYLNGAILGLTRIEVDEKFDEIIRFAELEEFVDQKLANFSSGMQVRLAFSVAIQAHSDILLIDEVLAVGDSNFQSKCFNVFRKLKAEGRTIVFVSHSMSIVREFCGRVIMLKDAEVLIDGSPEDAIFEYEKINSTTTSDNLNSNEIGDKSIMLDKIELDLKNELLTTGEDLKVTINYLNPNNIDKANFAVGIHRVQGGYMIGLDTKITNYGMIKLGKKGKVDLRIHNMPLLDGEYVINISCFGEDISSPYHFIKDIRRFKVMNRDGKSNFRGAVNVKHSWEAK